MPILSQIENVVGPTVMEMALVAYLAATGNLSLPVAVQMGIETKNLTHLLPAPNITVMDLIEDWNAKSNFDPPVVTVNATKNGSLVFSQVNGVRWLPITILTSRGYQELIWITGNETVTYNGQYSDTLGFLHDTNSTGDWVAVVQNRHSSFRVIYDEKLTSLLAQQLLLNHTALRVSIRMQLINDYFTCAIQSCGGLPPIPIELAMELTRYLGNEAELSVWEAFHFWEAEDSNFGRDYYFFDIAYQLFFTDGSSTALPALKV